MLLGLEVNGLGYLLTLHANGSFPEPWSPVAVGRDPSYGDPSQGFSISASETPIQM